MEALLLIWILLAMVVGGMADSRGRSPIGFFLLSALLSPLLGLIVLLVMRNLRDEERAEAQRRHDQAAQLESIRALATPHSTTPGASLADELQKLAALRDAGVLTPGEFEAQKSRLLAR